MSLLKLGSPDLGTCPACGQRLFLAAHVTRLKGQRFHSECIRSRRSQGRREGSAETQAVPAKA